MDMPKFDAGGHRLSGHEWHFYKQRCLYGWFRGNTCLYIGQSDQGIARFLAGHHVIGVLSPVKADDAIRLLFPVSNGADDQLDFLEERLIKYYRPVFNRTHNNINHEQRVFTGKRVREHQLPKNLRSQKEMAAVVLGDLQKRGVLENTQDYKDCTKVELEKRLQELKQAHAIIRRMPIPKDLL